MYPVSPDLHRIHHTCFEVQPFRPAPADQFLVGIGLGQPDKKMVMTRLALHEPAIELSQVGILQPFAQPLEPLAAAGFDQGETVTIPSLPNVADWNAFEAARQALMPNLSRSKPAERFKATESAETAEAV